MHGLIARIKAFPGQRDALTAILLEAADEMPGCLSYVVATDSKDAETIWVTEVWDSEESHKASLRLPAVKDAITRGKPLVADIGDHFVTTPLGGVGLPES
jgi:quinol monooxygenase YgiN